MNLGERVNVIPEFASTIALDQARGIEGGSVGSLLSPVSTPPACSPTNFLTEEINYVSRPS